MRSTFKNQRKTLIYIFPITDRFHIALEITLLQKDVSQKTLTETDTSFKAGDKKRLEIKTSNGKIFKQNFRGKRNSSLKRFLLRNIRNSN